MRALRPLAPLAACAVGAGLAFAGAGGAHVRPGGKRVAPSARSGALIPATRGELLPSTNGTVTSTNWSGYVVTSRRHRIAAVSSKFVVPAAQSSVLPRFAATWAGIGGYKTNDLIQAGAAEDSSGGVFGRRYFAWYELLPRSEQPIGHCRGDTACTVKPGQRMTVAIRRLGSGLWRISISDQGHWSWSKRVHYHSVRASAEWILEAPMVAMSQSMLAHVGTAHFGPTSRFTASGRTHTIAAGQPVRIVLRSTTGTREATPSGLAGNGQSFDDCSYHTTCSRP